MLTGEKLIGIFVIKQSELLSNSLYNTSIDELKLEFDAATSYSSKFFDGNIKTELL